MLIVQPCRGKASHRIITVGIFFSFNVLRLCGGSADGSGAGIKMQHADILGGGFSICLDADNHLTDTNGQFALIIVHLGEIIRTGSVGIRELRKAVRILRRHGRHNLIHLSIDLRFGDIACIRHSNRAGTLFRAIIHNLNGQRIGFRKSLERDCGCQQEHHQQQAEKLFAYCLHFFSS